MRPSIALLCTGITPILFQGKARLSFVVSSYARDVIKVAICQSTTLLKSWYKSILKNEEGLLRLPLMRCLVVVVKTLSFLYLHRSLPFWSCYIPFFRTYVVLLRLRVLPPQQPGVLFRLVVARGSRQHVLVV